MILNRNLILCFVDFSKAFDMVNRSILFYKIMKCGWYGKVIDTLRSLYTKTNFRVKHQGWLSHLIDNVMGVNQGGIASGFLFRKYMSDLGTFLDSECGICVGEKIIAHILWVTTRTEHRWLIKSCCASADVFSMWKLLLAILWYMGSVESCHPVYTAMCLLCAISIVFTICLMIVLSSKCIMSWLNCTS